MSTVARLREADEAASVAHEFRALLWPTPAGLSVADAYLTLAAAAAHLGIARRSLWQAIDAMDWQDGLGRRLAPVKPRRDWLIPVDHLNAETERRGRAPHVPGCQVCR